MILAELFAWFVEYLGTIASVFGAGFTILFSAQAKTAATAARQASNETRAQVSRLDVLSELTEAKRLMDDVANRLHGRSWEIIAERCTAIRLIIAPITSTQEIEFSSDVSEKLVEVIAQMKILSATANKVRYQTIIEPSIPKLSGLVDEQKEVLTLAISEVKKMIGQGNG